MSEDVNTSSAGAVYFFLGWGTRLGQRDSLMDLVFFLGLAMGIFDTLVVNPALKMVFNVGRAKPLHELRSAQRLWIRLGDIFLAIGLVAVVMAFYQGINLGAISIFDLPQDQVSLPGEPILFGLFFGSLKTLVLFIWSRWRRGRS